MRIKLMHLDIMIILKYQGSQGSLYMVAKVADFRTNNSKHQLKMEPIQKCGRAIRCRARENSRDN